jgi:glutathione synthase/RimK-type ligase-like ATP-grasp enzyme
MLTVGLLTCTDYPNLSPSDSELVKPLNNLGIEAVPVPWDSPEEEWKEQDTLVIRSTWNYHKKLAEFLNWVEEVEDMGIHLYNPINVVLWNYDKRYLHELQKEGVKIVPTAYVAKGQEKDVSEMMESEGWSDVVVKPSVGASAHGIKHISDSSVAQAVLADITRNTGALIQPVIPSIHEGEWSILFFNGKFSHSVLKKPGSGTIFVNSMYKGTWSHVIPEQQVIDDAAKALQAARKLSRSEDILYARVDGVITDDRFTLMEIELIEPGVYLLPETAPNFAKAISSVISKK